MFGNKQLIGSYSTESENVIRKLEKGIKEKVFTIKEISKIIKNLKGFKVYGFNS